MAETTPSAKSPSATPPGAERKHHFLGWVIMVLAIAALALLVVFLGHGLLPFISL